MMDELYSGALLDAAAAIPPRDGLETMRWRARRVSRVCGSEVEVGLAFTDGKVSGVAVDARACALGQAAASLFARHVAGATPTELIALRDRMHEMLKREGPVPEGEQWGALGTLAPIRAYPARHASTLLVFDAAAACAETVLEAAE